MNRIEELHKTTIENLSNEAAYASKQIARWSTLEITDTSFRRIPTNAYQYTKWTNRRIAILRDLNVLRNWTVREFHIALHNNLYDIQSLVFGASQN